MNAAVTDTHALLFHAARSKRLGKRARALFAAAEAQTSIIYVPVVVLWECDLLARVGKIDLGTLRGFATRLFSNPAYQPLDLTLPQVLLAAESRPNDDPFDALICAAARELELPLITRDADITEWDAVQVVW